MSFASLEFGGFLLAVLLVSWALRGRRAQNTFLLAASWCFYALFDWRFLGLMWLSTVTDYAVGRLLATQHEERRRTQVFVLSLVVNLGVLGFFKYFGFFVDSGAEALRALGFQADPPVLRILLPVGISFYTFHGISYTFDVYRRVIEPTRSFLDYALFVAFFPQQIAGPIGRAQLQLPQFERARPRPKADVVASGAALILIGLCKKVAVADAVVPIVTHTFGGAATEGWGTLAVGAAAFALQIYGDFSGYSNIARGTARLLGVELPVNFRLPYLSGNITEFWRRWHVSLSSWLRDYLYIPLGGNRGSRATTARNLLVTMTLGGLWHGASATFVVWGAAHGVLLTLHRTIRERASRRAVVAPASGVRTAASVVGTFCVVTALFVVFRADSLHQAADYLAGIATLRPGAFSKRSVLKLAYAATALVALDLAEQQGAREPAVLTWPALARGAAVGLMVVALVVFSGGARVPFVYFQF